MYLFNAVLSAKRSLVSVNCAVVLLLFFKDLFDYCTSCKGVWLDREEIDKIAKIQSNYDDDEHYNKYHYRNREYTDYYDDEDYYSNRRRKRGGILGELFDFN